MDPTNLVNRILYKHRLALRASRPTSLTLAHLLVEAVEAGYAAAFVNMRAAEAIAGAAIEKARGHKHPG